MGRKSRSKKLHKSASAAEAAMIERAQRLGPGDPLVIVQDPPGMEKMSQILVEFADPLLQVARNEEELRSALFTAMVAWNLSCLPTKEEQQWELRGRFMEALGPEGVEIVSNFIERKTTLFPEIKRLILDIELSNEGGDNLRLNVLSQPLDYPSGDDEQTKAD